jgi:hypothetical protein
MFSTPESQPGQHSFVFIEHAIVQGSRDRAPDDVNEAWIVEVQRMHGNADDRALAPPGKQRGHQPRGAVSTRGGSCGPGEDGRVEDAAVFRPRRP